MSYYIRCLAFYIFTICIIFSGFCKVCFAQLVFSAPPRETLEAGQKTYGPLVENLTRLLGERVVYEHPDNWREYEKKIRNDKYDIIFDGPQFVSWRMENLQAKPVVKLPGSLNFVLVVRKEDKAITNLKDFIGKKICTLPSPNLGALTLYSMFPNPILQPDFVPVTGGFKDVAIAFNAGKCEGAVLRSSFYHHILSSKFRSKIKVIKESQSFSNQGITLSKRVNHRASEKIFYALTSNNKNKVIKPILDRFGGKSSGFVPAKPEDYKGQNLLKDNLIFGW